MVTWDSKLEALHRAINWINKKDNSSIAWLGLDTSPLNSNAWLAGFYRRGRML